MGFFISLIIIIGIQFILQYVLMLFNIPTVIITLVVDFALSVLFSFFNFMGKEKLRNPLFHRSIAIYFVILTLMSLLFGQYF